MVINIAGKRYTIKAWYKLKVGDVIAGWGSHLRFDNVEKYLTDGCYYKVARLTGTNDGLMWGVDTKILNKQTMIPDGERHLKGQCYYLVLQAEDCPEEWGEAGY